MLKRSRAVIAAVLLGTVGGCSFAPPYHVPTMSMPAAYKETAPWVQAQPAELAAKGDWWTGFGDPLLSSLEQQIETGNFTLAAALSRYDRARAYLAQARSDTGVHGVAEGYATRNRQSNHRPLRGSNQPDLYAANDIDVSFNYELDLWGRVRNAIAAGRAEVAASDADTAAIKLSLQSELAAQYITLRGYDRQLELLDATVSTFSQADALTRRRFVGGVASGLDAGRSGTQLAEAQAQRSSLLGERALVEHAIASLVGTPASSFTIAPAPISLTLPAVPAGVPSTLLQRRPDIAAAERRVAAANAEIGVVKAAFFPAIRLSGTIGFQDTGGPGFLTAPNNFWSIGPGAILSLLDGGRRRAQLAVARSIHDEATAQYRADVLRAFQDVEDNLALLHHLADEASLERTAVEQAALTEKLSLNRYMAGAATFLDVATAQTTALRTRQTALDLETRRLEASVRLIQALGGGWSSADQNAS